MDRVYKSNTSQTPPEAPGSAGGYPREGSSLLGESSTVPGAYWFHSVTEELRNAIAALGVTPNKDAINQLAAGLTTKLDSLVLKARKINDKSLTSDITLTAADVGAVPTSRKINNKALSSDVTLTAADLGLVAYVTESYVNGTSGYRVWSNKFCEQWGRYTGGVAGAGFNRVIPYSSNTFINLLKPYKNANYCVIATALTTAYDDNWDFNILGAMVQENYRFGIHVNRGRHWTGCHWCAFGFIA